MTTLLGEVYDAVTATVAPLDSSDFERPTRAAAWNVRQLLFHQLLDAQRTLVALASPTDADADVDAVTYWAPWRPSVGDGGAAHAAFVVRAAAAFDALTGPAALVDWWRTTSAAAARAVAAAPPERRVETQGHVITVADLASTLVVEATVHLLDATLQVPGGPPAAALAHTRRVLDGLYGGPLPEGPDDARAILRATGRLPSEEPAYPLLG